MATPLPPSASGADETRPPDRSGLESAPTAAPTVESPASRSSALPALQVGQDFGARYHIIRLLGIGGMGAVYQAWDKVLEVAVAIKIIRPDATLDPDAAQALTRRFKRELLLARQVTHRNVVRIHDLGEIDGITYITMPYVQGSNLAAILKREGRLPLDRAIGITRQVASGLSAAHDAGVVHRDLKPANIMVDPDDQALIMDFGIARSTAGATLAMTAAGAVVGTVEYMAPEQAKGVAVDERADIYSLGLILHDMLVGCRRVGASTAVLELLNRIQQPPPPVRLTDPTIPPEIDALITRCLQPDPAARYQRIRDLLQELERPDGVSPTAAAPTITVQPGRQPDNRRRAVAAAAALAVLAAVGWTVWTVGSGPATSEEVAHAPVSLAVLPFRNLSGDPGLDSLGPSISQVLATTLGQSAHVRTVPPDRLHQVLQDLHIAPSAALSPAQLANVADFTSVQRVLWGTYSRFGEAIRLDATLQDLEQGETRALNALAPNEAGMLTAIAALADAVRQDLARGAPDILEALRATGWKPSTHSFEALRLYNDGLQLTQRGSHQAAQKAFEAAVKEDANFALALSGLAQSYAFLGYDTEASRFSRQAMSLSDGLPPQERYRIAATHYHITNEIEQAIESYENLLEASPEDTMVRFTLGSLYEQRGALDEARQHFVRIVERDPKFVEALLAVGRVEIRSGRAQASLEPLDRALTLAAQLDNPEARANILQAIGIAHMRLNRPEEALRRYQESLEIKERLGDKRGMAASLVQMGEVQRTLGDPEAAEQSYQSALTLRREIGDRAGLSLTLMDLAALYNDQFARSEDALPLLQEALTIVRETGNTNLEARALNNIGVVYQTQGKYSDAQTYFERALELRERAKAPQEAADTLHNLGVTLTRMGRYESALQRYVRALELRRSAGDQRGAAIESYGIGTIFDYQGRYGAAAQSKHEAVQSLRGLNQRDAWLGEVLGGYGESLTLAGRADDARAPLEEALSLANELRNHNLVARTRLLQAKRTYYAGDAKSALPFAEEAAAVASRAADRTLALLAQVDLAILSSVLQPTRELAARLDTLAQQADAQGLQAIAVECLVHRADTLLRVNDHTAARREAERAIARSEALGLRLLLAKAHYLRATILHAKDDSAARRDYAATLRLLEEIKADDGNQHVLTRTDLSVIHAESLRRATGS